ncbi:MAG: hypothetical protein AAGD00_02945 [Planctomycetota bacterium]
MKLAGVIACVLGVVLSGCASLGVCEGSGRLEIVSANRGSVIVPGTTTAVYRSTDPNTADLYLSDLEPDVLVRRLSSPPGSEGAGASGVSGSVLHVRMFLNPKAGRTPIDFTASNTSVRYIVFANDAVGVYTGGAFLLPSDRPGEASFAGRLGGGNLRLLSSDGPFVDLLGAAKISGRVGARLDEELAERIGARMLLFTGG